MPGITVFDAETDADLTAVVAQAGGSGAAVLWCGTGGLAHALAGGDASATPQLPTPILGLFGSDQAVTAAQLAACHPHWHALPDASPPQHRQADRRPRPARCCRREPFAAAGNAARGSRHSDRGSLSHPGRRPGRAGNARRRRGETLRGLCMALGATSLEVQGSIMPGVPVSRLRGGRWDGVTVVSKSGAFGHSTLLRDLLRIPDLERAVS